LINVKLDKEKHSRAKTKREPRKKADNTPHLAWPFFHGRGRPTWQWFSKLGDRTTPKL